MPLRYARKESKHTKSFSYYIFANLFYDLPLRANFFWDGGGEWRQVRSDKVPALQAGA